MIVTFTTNPTGTADSTSMYLNMLRCITAIVTAPAGTSNIIVNPYTSSNVINTSSNCIVRIDCNNEAGGWTASTKHFVPSGNSFYPVANNTSQAFTAMASQSNYQYLADFYNASTKSATPYKKITFHTWTTSTTVYSPMTQTTTPVTPYLSAMTGGIYTHLLVTYGSSTTTDWTDTSYPPGGTSSGSMTTSTGYNNSTQTKSTTFNAYSYIYSSSIYYPPTGLWWDKPNTYYTVAATADYIIIWEYNSSYTAYTAPTQAIYPFTSTYHGHSCGSIYYFGIRDTHPWEDQYTNNVPWVAWSCIPNYFSYGTSNTAPWPQEHVAANMMTLSTTHALKETAPKIYSFYNTVANNSFISGINPYSVNSLEYQTNSPGYYTGAYTGYLDSPIFYHNVAGSSTVNNVNYNAPYIVANHPILDPTTGNWELPAYPIKIQKNFNNRWNQGGACKGIYKSMTYYGSTMLTTVWQTAGQKFTVNGEDYIPIKYGNDIWLVRWA